MRFIFTILLLAAFANPARAETTSSSVVPSNSDHGVERGSQVNFSIYEGSIDSSLKIRLIELLDEKCNLSGVVSVHLENFEIRELNSNQGEFKQVFVFTLSIIRDPALPGPVTETVKIELGRKESSDDYIDIHGAEPIESATSE